jgi:phage-related protein
MMRIFTINNTPSSDFGIYLADSNLFDSAAEDVEYIEIAGRNGALTVSNNRFKSFTARLECYCIKDMQTNINNFKNYLMSLKGGFVLKDSVHAGVFRIGRNDSFKLDDSDRNKAVFTLSINCRPEIYLESGLTEVNITSGDILTNPTFFDSKPLIAVKGNGTLNIGDYELTVNTSQTSLTIDCEAMNCYNNNVNCNNDVTLTDFPVLKTGKNEITFTDFTEVKITPRWWRV